MNDPNSPSLSPIRLVEADIADLLKSGGTWQYVLVPSTTAPFEDDGVTRHLLAREAISLPSRAPRDDAPASSNPPNWSTGTRLKVAKLFIAPIKIRARSASLILLPTIDAQSTTTISFDQLSSALSEFEHLIVRRRSSAYSKSFDILAILPGTGVGGLSPVLVVERLLRLAIKLAPYGCGLTICESNPDTAAVVRGVLESPRVADILREIQENRRTPNTNGDGRVLRQNSLRRAALLVHRIEALQKIVQRGSSVAKTPQPIQTFVNELPRMIEGVEMALLHDLLRGLMARNLLAHGQICDPTDIEFGLAASNRVLQLLLAAGGEENREELRRLRSEEANFLSQQSGWEVRVFSIRRPTERINDTQPTEAKLSPASPAANASDSFSPETLSEEFAGAGPTVASAHIEQLTRFLQDGLDAIESETLLTRLRDVSGYSGPDTLVLREACWRADPLHLLSDLGSTALQRLYQRSFRKPVPAQFMAPGEIRAFAEHILGELGFPKQMRLHGLHDALSEVEKFYAKSRQEADTEALTGHVIHAAGHMEHVLKLLICFLCAHLFRKSPEKHFQGTKPQYTKGFFNRSSLGTRLSLLADLAEQIDSANLEDLPELGGPLRGGRLIPEANTTLANLRNSFGHFNAQNPPTPTTARINARMFFEEATKLLQWWKDAKPEIYPHLIRIVDIRIDRWNRLTAHAIDDRGHPEVIISSELLQSGRTYFMYPLNNPCRVDPILIETGVE